MLTDGGGGGGGGGGGAGGGGGGGGVTSPDWHRAGGPGYDWCQWSDLAC